MIESEFDWKLTQVLGNEDLGKVEPEDIVTSMSFDASGRYLAVGDKGGRIVIFEDFGFENPSLNMNNQFQFLCEFQSHQREFDFLK